MAVLETLALVAILLVVFYKWATAKFGVLKERGVPHAKPKPLIGNLGWDVMTTKTSFMKFLINQHLQNKDKKVYGYYGMRDPVVVVNDVELIKKVGIKDFDYFPNHRMAATSDDGTNFDRSLIGLRDHKWKQMRNTLTPTFTGSKMRQMFELINEVCLAGVRYLEDETQAEGRQELDLEMKDYFMRFANDVIASAAFGIKVDSFKEKENKFYRVGRALTQIKSWIMIKMFLYSLIPRLMKLLRVEVFDSENVNYFNHLVLDAMKYRQEHQIIRPDMIHLLMEAKKNFDQAKAAGSNEDANLEDKDLVAQCLLFFFAGFETVSNCLCFTAHELLENPDVQQRLYEEILEVQQELGDKPLNYDALMQMKYMDRVLSESLRKWPPAIITDRVCSKDYTLTDDDGNVLAQLKKDDNIWFPIIGLHQDPDNFENPHQFDPERFSDENKDTIKPFTYLPFGVGPRNCIGNRLALMETKAIIYHMLLRFRIVAGEKTSKNLYEDISGFQMKPKGGFWMKLVPRERTE